ncbi:MAG: transglycosylase domain-containing protein [Solirubrobacteraceae bacterium]
MSDIELPRIAPPEDSDGANVLPLRPSDKKALDERRRRRVLRESRRRRPPKVIRWRRLFLLMIPLGLLALVSTIFGMVLAVAAELPSINHFILPQDPENSVILDDAGHRIAVMTDVTNPANYVPTNEIPPLMKRAIVALEDKRFYSESGVDIKGIARAFIDDFTGSGTTQGASTITEQLVKQIRKAEYHRTIFEKLTEAAIAFQLAHKYSKDQILGAYLNDIYYGNGAWGIEAAAQTYFGNDPNSSLWGCGYSPGNPSNLCVEQLTPADAALLASLVQNPPSSWSTSEPYFYNRRNTDLLYMLKDGYLSSAEYEQAVKTPLPPPQYVVPPSNQSPNPGYGYFTSWVEQQVLADKKSLPHPYTGGYRIHTTFDEPLQNVAQRIIQTTLPQHTGLPEASLVAINNANGGVMAMFGGYNYQTSQWNLATQAERQPGSSWKVFELAKALARGVSPNTVLPSAPWTYKGGPGPPFPIRNDEATYAGHRTLFSALTYSDNTVFARVGLLYDGVNPVASLNNVAHYAHDFGITTDISRNPSMTIGGLYTGVTTLDMAHAYSTIARGNLISGTLASTTCAGGLGVSNGLATVVNQTTWKNGTCPGPVGITLVNNAKGKDVAVNEPRYSYIPGFSAYLDSDERAMLRSVVTEGTGTAADIPNFVVYGKTGTTSEYKDAWWIGFTQPMPGLPDGMTVAVWVGYNTPRPMRTQYGGKPVYGGTYPADIFRAFVEAAIPITKTEAYDRAHNKSEQSLILSTEASTPPSVTLPAYGSAPTSSTTGTGTATGGGAGAGTTTGGTTGNTGTGTGTGTQTPTTPPVSGPGGGAAAP